MKKFHVLNFCNDTLLQNSTPKSDDLLSEKLWGPCSSEKLSMKKRLAGNFHNLWVSTFHVQKMTLNDHTKAAMCYGPRQVRRKVLFWNSIFLCANLWSSRCPFGGNEIVANPLIPLMTTCTDRLWTTVIVQIWWRFHILIYAACKTRLFVHVCCGPVRGFSHTWKIALYRWTTPNNGLGKLNDHQAIKINHQRTIRGLYYRRSHSLKRKVV